MIQSIYFLKKISVELFKAEITVFFQIMKETFFQYANCILNTTLIDIVNIGLHFFLKNIRPYATSCNES